ncbi:hypothetical protein D3C72_1261140 [compost metagenome]
MAADSVIQQIDRYAFGGFLQQQSLQALAEAVVVDDEKLDQHGLFRLADGIENGLERRLAVDQQPHLVIGQAGHVSELGHRSE